MEEKFHTTRSPQFAFGIIIICLGVLFTLDNIGFLNAHDYLRFWPTLLMAWGAFRFFAPAKPSDRMFGIIFFTAGSLILLRKLDIINFNIWTLWPLALVFIGASMLWNSKQRRTSNMLQIPANDSDNSFNRFVFMSGINQQFSTKEFRGGEITAIMGGAQIDLRDADMDGETAHLDIFAFWGGVELRVPDHWTVVLQATPIMGGFDDKTRTPKESSKKLIITGYAIMGGAEIKN